MRVDELTKLVCRSMVIGWLTMPATSLIADTPAFVLGEVLSTQPASFTGTRGWRSAGESVGEPTRRKIIRISKPNAPAGTKAMVSAVFFDPIQ